MNNNSEKKEISIVIPVYNVERYLKDTLFSIINQNFSSWEMICVDDCSTDGSTDILDTFSKLDPRITVIHLSENSGAGYATGSDRGLCHHAHPVTVLIAGYGCTEISVQPLRFFYSIVERTVQDYKFHLIFQKLYTETLSV